MKSHSIFKLAIVLLAAASLQTARAENIKNTDYFEDCKSAVTNMAVASSNSNREIEAKSVKLRSLTVTERGRISPSDEVQPLAFNAEFTDGSDSIKVRAHLVRGGCEVTYFNKI